MRARNDPQFASYALAMDRVFSRGRFLAARIILTRHRTKFFASPVISASLLILGIVTEAFAVLRHA
jgi:hypothetical protein